jgi:hypothetical protein
MYRTGTTSLGLALEWFGYRATYKFWNQFPKLAPYFDLDTSKFEPLAKEIRAEADRFDAFSDAPWLYLYRELDEWYPGSRFILTIRSSTEAVVKSEFEHWDRAFIMERWLKQEDRPPTAEQFARRYEQHNENVRTYFKDRPDDLLEICFETEAQPWRRLCEFLSIDAVPEEPFPHANRTQAHNSAIEPHGST